MVVSYFKDTGPGWQARMDLALTQFVATQDIPGKNRSVTPRSESVGRGASGGTHSAKSAILTRGRRGGEFSDEPDDAVRIA